MDLAESFIVEAPVDRVWPLLQDVSVVAECLPGTELRDQDGDTYEGTIALSFGPTRVTFTGQAEITYPPGDKQLSIAARGRDARGASRASAQVLVSVRPQDARTAIDISGDVDVLGPLAQFARAGGVFITRQLLKDFAAAIGARAVAGEAAQEAEQSEGMVAGRATTAPAARSQPAAVGGFSLVWRAFVAWFRERVGGRRSTRAGESR